MSKKFTYVSLISAVTEIDELVLLRTLIKSSKSVKGWSQTPHLSSKNLKYNQGLWFALCRPHFSHSAIKKYWHKLVRFFAHCRAFNLQEIFFVKLKIISGKINKEQIQERSIRPLRIWVCFPPPGNRLHAVLDVSIRVETPNIHCKQVGRSYTRWPADGSRGALTHLACKDNTPTFIFLVCILLGSQNSFRF